MAALLLAGCDGSSASGPPRLVVDQAVCAGCSMLISERAFAGAYRAQGRELLFDDLGCLLASLAEDGGAGSAEVWVHDFETGTWLRAEEARFVRAPALRTPMGSGIAAVGDPAAADALASRIGGRAVGGLSELEKELRDVP